MNSKIVKKIIFIIATLIFVVLISSLGNKCFAVSRNNADVNGVNYGDLFSQGKTVSLNIRFMQSNNYTFCIQDAQSLYLSHDYPNKSKFEVIGPITIDGSKRRFRKWTCVYP